jgi:uncharacterized Zn finger protein
MVVKIIKIKCPICEEDVDLGDSLFEGDMAECYCCGEILELKRDRKGKWSLILVEEDWDEEEEDN